MNFWERLRYLFSADFPSKIGRKAHEYEWLETTVGEQGKALERLAADCEKQKRELSQLREERGSLSRRCDLLEARCRDLAAALQAVAADGGNREAVSYELTESDMQEIAAIVSSNLKPEERRTEYYAIEEKIRRLQARMEALERQKKELVRMEKEEREEKRAEPVRDNRFSIPENREKDSVSAGSLERVLSRICNPSPVDDFFMNIPSDNVYKKLFERYKKNIRKCADRVSQEDDLEDTLNLISSVVQDDLLKRIVLPIYRGMKTGGAETEKKLLARINEYLQGIGFYTRDNIRVGQIMTDKDFDDMEFIRDDRGEGGRHGEITEIELYPYYLNYIDETGKREFVHTQGKMIVIA